MNEAQKEKKRKYDREAFQKKRDKLRGPTETARIKAEKEKKTIIKAEKELQQIKSERRQQPEIMWKRLIEESGKEFEDVVFKKPLEYNF
jgi:regulator of protease activity HflC (stomatin/prohibitin superfamily)